MMGSEGGERTDVAAAAEAARYLYLDLLKRSLLGETYLDNELRLLYLRRCLAGKADYDESLLYDIRRFRPEESERFAARMAEGFPIDTDLQELPFCSTMLGRARLEHVEQCVKTILAERIPGDLVECGVWRGGSVAFMRGLLSAYGVTDRLVWVADSFRGLPRPTARADVALGLDLSRERFPALAVDLETVRRTFSSHGLLDEQVRFLPGWFADTLPGAPIERLSLLRADGDLYESTRDVLDALYDRVVPGGFVVIDDYFLPCCREAVADFLVRRQLTVSMQRIDWTGVYWRKEA